MPDSQGFRGESGNQGSSWIGGTLLKTLNPTAPSNECHKSTPHRSIHPNPYTRETSQDEARNPEALNLKP